MLAFMAWATLVGIFVGIYMDSWLFSIGVLLMFGFLISVMSNANNEKDD